MSAFLLLTSFSPSFVSRSLSAMMEAILNGLLGGGNRDSSPCGEDDEAMQSEDASRPCYAFRLYHWEEVEPRAPGGSPAALSTSFGRHLPKPRSGHKVVYYRGGLYSFGGYNPKVELSDPHLLVRINN